MKNADQIRHLLQQALTYEKKCKIKHPNSRDATQCYKWILENMSKCIGEALALLPCPTCNGTGKKMITDLHGGKFGNYIPCSDCQPKLCVCCEEITEENAHLHRNCGK